MTDYLFIVKNLGEDWLKRQSLLMNVELKQSNPKLDAIVIDNLLMQMLEKIDELIHKLEHIRGFNEWANEARTSEDLFKNCLFELMILEHLHAKADYIEIKRKNGSYVPDAFIRKGKEEFYVEMKALNKVPDSISTKVTHLLSNARSQFTSSRGMIFIGCSPLFSFNGEVPIATKEFREFLLEVERRIRDKNMNTRIKAVFLTHVYIALNSSMNKIFIQKYLYQIWRPSQVGGYDEELAREIFDVDGFVEV